MFGSMGISLYSIASVIHGSSSISSQINERVSLFSWCHKQKNANGTGNFHLHPFTDETQENTVWFVNGSLDHPSGREGATYVRVRASGDEEIRTITSSGPSGTCTFLLERTTTALCDSPLHIVGQDRFQRYNQWSESYPSCGSGPDAVVRSKTGLMGRNRKRA